MMRDTPSILPVVADRLAFEAGGQRRVDDLSFSLAKSGITAIIGPNGAGKSLTLRLLHGLLEPTSGAVRWQIARGEQNGRRRHAMVFQRPVMLRRSVRDTLVHGLAAGGVPNSRQRAAEVLEHFGLGALADNPARKLSGGEQQRLAIARASALEPELLLLDEPCANLDPGATRQIEAVIQGLAANGMTILMTTHDLGQARRLANRILFLNRGRLKADQPAADFFAAPASSEASAFLAGDLLW